MPFASLEELKAALKDHEKLEDVIEYIMGAVNAEKSKGQELKRQSDKQAADRRFKLKAVVDALKKAGYEPTDAEDEFAGVPDYLEDLAEKLGSASGGTTPSSDTELAKELRKLRRDFERTKSELEKEREASTELKTKSARRVMMSKLSDALRDKIYGHDIAAKDLINDGRVTLDEDDESVVFIDGEDRLPFEDGVKRFLESRPDLLKNQQTPGARTTASTKQSSKAKYSRSQIESMTPEEIQADMEAVEESWEAIRQGEMASTS